jgi:ribosomal-protein-alanine N-acetyltransferase
MLRLERASGTAAHWSEAEYGRLFQEDGLRSRLSLVACNCSPQELPDEQLHLIGFLIARHVAAECELENVVVAAESRGRGVGTQLMQALFAQAERTKSESVFLEVRESNESARRLYEKLGFKETGRRKSYYTRPLEDAVLYTKALLEG